MTSRAEAQDAIAAGLVRVDGAPAMKPTTQVHAGQALFITAPPREFVSRGGHKLAGALAAFGLDVTGRHALDAGISTGGFTDCLLQRGVLTVLGIDVGYGQVAEKLRQDVRVTIRERTNIREVTPDQIADPRPDLLVADLSFISLALVLPGLLALVAPLPTRVDAVLLVKPQFEAGRRDVASGGVVREPSIWGRCLVDVSAVAVAQGWGQVAAVPSPIRGPAGNVEFLLHLQRGQGDGLDAEQVAAAVAAGTLVRDA